MFKILFSLLFLNSFVFSMDFYIFNVTTIDSFNYFFSFPIWFLILSIPMILALSALKYFK